MRRRMDGEEVAAVVEGEQTLFEREEREEDRIKARSLKGEFTKLKMVEVGVSEGWMVAERIAAERVPVIASALNDLPQKFEMLAATQSNVGRMPRAGVTVAIGMIDDNDARHTRRQTPYEGHPVALGQVPGPEGLNWGQAVAATTTTAPENMGL